MGRSPSAESCRGAVTPYTAACERVLRYLRLVGFERGGRRIRIASSDDCGTHWLLTFAVSSLEDPSRDFMHASIVVEKDRGYIYDFPSCAQQPIDAGDIASIRQGCIRITPSDLDQMGLEEKRRVRGPTCRDCGSSNVHCAGGRLFRVSGLERELIQWAHTCPDCSREACEWVSELPVASEWRCPHLDCESVWQREDHRV